MEPRPRRPARLRASGRAPSTSLAALDRPIRRVAAGVLQVGVDPGHDLRMVGGHVFLLARVIGEVVERQGRIRPALADPGPAPLITGRLAEALLVELPVEELVRRLIA